MLKNCVIRTLCLPYTKDLLLKEHRSKVALGEEDGGVFDNESDAAVVSNQFYFYCMFDNRRTVAASQYVS